jgi:hypothetical protein
MDRHGVRTAILVGIGERTASRVESMIEQAIQERATVIARLDVTRYQSHGERFVLGDGRALPFRDACADLVYSNAVIEHVGGEPDQERFLSEHARVGRTWIATTPNRWFPVESHTLVVLRHWSREHRQRERVVYSRLLSLRELTRILPGKATVKERAWSPTLTAVGTRDASTLS